MFWGRVEMGNNIYIWAGRMWFWFIPKMVSTASSSTGALVAAGSLQPVWPSVVPHGVIMGTQWMVGWTGGAWSELAATNSPVEDEAVEPVSRTNILLAPARMGFFFRILPTPKFSTKKFLYLLPPSSPLLPTTYLPPPTYHLPPPSYVPPASPLLPTTYKPHTPSLHCQSSRDVKHLELELRLDGELELERQS